MAAETEVISLSLDESSKSSPIPAIRNLSGAVGVEVDFRDKTIYFSQVGFKIISKYLHGNGNNSEYRNLTETTFVNNKEGTFN